jgi:hypothetical protein
VTKSAETICTVTCVSGEDYNNDPTHSSQYSSSPPHSTGTQVLGGLRNEGRKRYKDKRRRERNGKKGRETERQKDTESGREKQREEMNKKGQDRKQYRQQLQHSAGTLE